jgi:hypothetical protein
MPTFIVIYLVLLTIFMIQHICAHVVSYSKADDDREADEQYAYFNSRSN